MKSKSSQTTKSGNKETKTISDTSKLLEQRNAELAVINSVQEGLAAEMDLQGIYTMVGDKIRDLFDAQVVSISTLDSDIGAV